MAVWVASNPIYGSVALADNILGNSQYTGYFINLGPKLLVAVVFANGRAVVANVLANTKKKFRGFVSECIR